MSKRSNIADTMHEAAGSTRVSDRTGYNASPPSAKPADDKTVAVPAASQASRAGTKAITGHFPPQVRYQLRLLAAEQDRKVEDMLAEALNRLFAAYNKPEIAPTATRAKWVGA